jgi:hypothetical protein
MTATEFFNKGLLPFYLIDGRVSFLHEMGYSVTAT